MQDLITGLSLQRDADQISFVVPTLTVVQGACKDLFGVLGN